MASSMVVLSQLDRFLVPKGPPKAFYIPEFITEYEEQSLIRNIYSAPKPKWRQLANRRLQNWGGLPHPKGMIAEELPEWLHKYVQRVTNLQVFNGNSPNHVLVNEYLPGQGIMPHTDGPLFNPTITTINLGSHTILDLYDVNMPTQMDISNVKKENTNDEECHQKSSMHYAGSLFLRPRSLLVLQEDLYVRCHHGIDGVHSDVVHNADSVLNADAAQVETGDQYKRDTRISVTIRHVPKTLKIKFK